MRAVRKTLSGFLLILLLALVTLLIVPPMVGWSNLVVLSDSMEPTLHKDDLICVQPCTIEEIQIGDIITFTDRHGDSITHRVIDISDYMLTTKGDANVARDAEFVVQENLVGKVRYHIPFLGRIVRLLKGESLEKSILRMGF